MKFAVFNVNHGIRFKPNDVGLKRMGEHFLGRTMKADDGGFYTTQAWVFMNIFGPHLSLGGDSGFDCAIEVELTEVTP